MELWLIVDADGNAYLPNELMLTKVDLSIATEWFRQRASEWPKDAIKHIEVLGLALQPYTQKHQAIHDAGK